MLTDYHTSSICRRAKYSRKIIDVFNTSGGPFIKAHIVPCVNIVDTNGAKISFHPKDHTVKAFYCKESNAKMNCSVVDIFCYSLVVTNKETPNCECCN